MSDKNQLENKTVTAVASDTSAPQKRNFNRQENKTKRSWESCSWKKTCRVKQKKT